MFSLGHGMIAASPSIKKPNNGDRNCSAVISFNLTVIELNSISSVINLTDSCITALISFTPSV